MEKSKDALLIISFILAILILLLLHGNLTWIG